MTLVKNDNRKEESRCTVSGRGWEVWLFLYRVSSQTLPGPRVMASFQRFREEPSVFPTCHNRHWRFKETGRVAWQESGGTFPEAEAMFGLG